MLLHVAACCSVFQCVPVYCSVVQCVALCRSLLQCIVKVLHTNYNHTTKGGRVNMSCNGQRHVTSSTGKWNHQPSLLICRDTGLIRGDTGLICRIIRLFCGDTRLFCGDTRLFCGDTRLFCGDMALLSPSVAVFCSVLRCVAACYGVLQGAAVCCSVCCGDMTLLPSSRMARNNEAFAPFFSF